MLMAAQTPTQKLADVLLGGPGSLELFVRSRRDAGTSWRLIAKELAEATDDQVDLALETLRLWYPDVPEQATGS